MLQKKQNKKNTPNAKMKPDKRQDSDHSDATIEIQQPHINYLSHFF
jgi:hypothetical protein